MGIRSFVKSVVDKIRPPKPRFRLRDDLPPAVAIRMPEGTSPEALGSFLQGGPLPPGARIQTIEEFEAEGRVADCDCQLIQCVCQIARQHQQDCKFRRALTCAVPITCEPHRQDVCAICDPCTCGEYLDDEEELARQAG